MAATGIKRGTKVRKRTSIGKGPTSKPRNKQKRKNWKKYRGQGK